MAENKIRSSPVFRIFCIQALKFGFDIAVLAASSVTHCGFRSELPEDQPTECITQELAQRMQRVGAIFTVVILVVLLFQLVRKVRRPCIVSLDMVAYWLVS